MNENSNRGQAAYEGSDAVAHGMGPRFPGTLKDMRFMGIMSMIYGILTCISIVGIPLGIPLIIASTRFLDGVGRFDNFVLEGAQGEMRAGFEELGRSFRILKILTIIYLVLMGLYFFFLFFLGGIGLLAELTGS